MAAMCGRMASCGVHMAASGGGPQICDPQTCGPQICGPQVGGSNDDFADDIPWNKQTEEVPF